VDSLRQAHGPTRPPVRSVAFWELLLNCCGLCSSLRKNRRYFHFTGGGTGKIADSRLTVRIEWRISLQNFAAPLRNMGHPVQNLIRRRREAAATRPEKDQERFLPARPGAQKPGGRKSRVASLGMTCMFGVTYGTAEQVAEKDQERFLPVQRGAQKPGGGKSRVASLGMTVGCGWGFMSELKLRPPRE